MLELRLIGRPRIFWQGDPIKPPSPKNLALLCYLAVQREACSRSDLIRMFWPSGKRASLRFALHKLRELPGAQTWLETPEHVIQVRTETDVERFEAALKAQRFAQALGAWQLDDESSNTFLNGLDVKDAPEFNAWLEHERERLHATYLQAMRGYLHQLEAATHSEEALVLARDLLEQDPLNEAVHRSIMRLENKAGRPKAALAHFEVLREQLSRELSLEPSQESFELLHEIEGFAASGAKSAVLVNHPEDLIDLPENFIGRRDVLTAIQTKLTEHSNVLIQGFGGAGKTALAASVAAQRSQEVQVLWLRAGHDPVEVLFDAIARAYQEERALSQASSPASFIRNLLAQQQPGLIVLDDVWNSDALTQLRATLPTHQDLLVTSRQRLAHLSTVTIGKLSRADALTLLAHYADSDASTLIGAEVLCQLLGDHAFSLRIAGITLAVDEISPEALLQRIARAPHRLKAPTDFAEKDRDSIVSLLSASLEVLPDDAYEAFMALGSLFSSRCTPELLSMLVHRSEEACEEALYSLARRGLAERLVKAGSDHTHYQLHDLAHSFARANNHYRRSSVRRACHDFLHHHAEHFDLLDLEQDNVLGAARDGHVSGESQCLIDMMRLLVVGKAYFTARGHSPVSLRLLENAIDAAKSLQQHEAAHFLLARLGDTYRELKADFDQAIEAYREALTLARLLQLEHRQILMLSLLGSTHFQKQSASSKDYFQEAYQLAKRCGDDLGLSLVLQNLGAVAGIEEDYDVAERYCLETLEVAKRLSQDDRYRAEAEKNIFFALHNLSVAHHRRKRYTESLKVLTEAHTFALQHDNQLWEAYALQEMAEVYHLKRARGAALEHFQRALDLYKHNHATAEVKALMAFLAQEDYTTELKQRESDVLKG